jgi:transposase
MLRMAGSQCGQAIPTKLSVEQFEQFVLPHLSKDRRGPAKKLSFHAIFNYILRLLYLGCQWKELPIENDSQGLPEIHYTRIYRAFRLWQADGCFEAIFEGSVFRLRQDDRLDTTVIHDDGTTTAAKNGGDNLGFSGHKKVKGDKVVAFCDRHCNVIAPFVTAPGNRNESPLLREALPQLTRIARTLGLHLRGTIVSLDGVYDCRQNRKSIFNRDMVPNINPRIHAVESDLSEDASPGSIRPSSKSGSVPSSGCSPGKISSGACCCALTVSVSCTTHSRPLPIR